MANICDIYEARITKGSSVIIIGPGLKEHVRGISEAPARIPYDPNTLFFATCIGGGILHLFDRPGFEHTDLQNFFTHWQKLGTHLCSIHFILGDIRLQEDRGNSIDEGGTVRKDVAIIDHLTFSRHIAPYIIFDMDERLYPPHVEIWEYFARIYMELLGRHSGKIIMHFEDSHWQLTLRERMKEAFSGQGCHVEIIEDIEDIYRLDDEHIWEMVRGGLIDSARFNLRTRQIVPAFSSKSILIAKPVSFKNNSPIIPTI